MIRNPANQGFSYPEDNALIGCSFDPVAASGGTIVPASGSLQVVKIRIPQRSLVTAIIMVTTVAGSGLTAGQNFALLYDSTKTLVGQSADQATAWAAAAGVKDMPLVTPVTVDGPYCYAAFYANGSTLPTWRSSSAGASVGNINVSGASSRFGSANTGLTSTPPSTIGATSIGTPWLVALR